MRADLHTHTHYSDGEHSPTDVIRHAKEAGLDVVAVTDHNTISGVEEAIKAGKRYGVRVIPAVEIMTREGEVNGYFVDHKSKEFQKELKRFQARMHEKTRRLAKALREQGHDISLRQLDEEFPYSKNNRHIAHLILHLHRQGYESREDVIDNIRGASIRNPPVKDVSMVTAIRTIRRYGGVAVLNHPWLSPEALKEKNIKRYVKAGLQGVELENGDEDRFGRTKKIIKRILRVSKKYGLVLTQGSDYHGASITELSGGHQLGRFYCSGDVVAELERRR